MPPYLIVVEEAGAGFSAYAPDLPGCVATGETLDTARIDPDRQPDHRKPVEIQVKRNGQIVGKGW